MCENRLKYLPKDIVNLQKLKNFTLYGGMGKEYSGQKDVVLTPEQERFISQIEARYWANWGKSASKTIEEMKKELK